MRLRFWNSSQSSTFVMMEGCFDTPKTSAPRLKTFVATNWFAPLMRPTTAITAATPITTPRSVSTLRSLWAHKLDVAIATASERFIDCFAVVLGENRFAVLLDEDRFAITPIATRLFAAGTANGLVKDPVSGWSMEQDYAGNALILTYARMSAEVTGDNPGLPPQLPMPIEA